ncbi:unnamed protein product [Scytosiphon promiscuus]
MTRRTNPIKLLAMEVEEADVQLEQLLAAAEDAGVDDPYARSAQQDNLEYEEFRQPDVNGDNVISKTEFNQYIRKYLALYPDTAPQDIPMFEEFDLNHDGMVTFDEWQMYLDKHRQADEYADSELMRGMYDTSANSNVRCCRLWQGCRCFRRCPCFLFLAFVVGIFLPLRVVVDVARVVAVAVSVVSCCPDDATDNDAAFGWGGWVRMEGPTSSPARNASVSALPSCSSCLRFPRCFLFVCCCCLRLPQACSRRPLVAVVLPARWSQC